MAKTKFGHRNCVFPPPKGFLVVQEVGLPIQEIALLPAEAGQLAQEAALYVGRCLRDGGCSTGSVLTPDVGGPL